MRGKYMRKLICCMLVAMMGVTQLCSVVSQAADISGLASESRLPIVLTLGADLSEDQKRIDQSEVTTITITNADEKEKLGNLISAEKIGSYTYSCALVNPTNAGGIQVTVRDPAFHDRSRQKQLPAPTHLIRDLTNAAMALTEELWIPPAPIRALTVTAIHLSPDGEAYEQANLFDPTAGQRNARQEKLESAMDAIRKKYGGGAIVYGAARPEKEEDPLP